MRQESFIFLKPTDITVKDNLPRFREDLGNVGKLLESIKKHGQLHPVIINRDHELIAGGRRLAACTLGEIEVKCAYYETVDDYTMREIELEENIARKSLTPAEEVMAVKELHTIKQKIYGVATSGKEGGWTLDDTAKILDKSRASIIDDIALADAVTNFPMLRTAGKKSDIKKAMKAIKKVAAVVGANKEHKEVIAKSSVSDRFKLDCADMAEHIKSIETGTIDLLLADPPYGINIHSLSMGLGGKTGGELSTTGVKYDDSLEAAVAINNVLAVEGYRITKYNAHGFIFVAPEHFYKLREIYSAAGWLCHIKPMIWVKGTSGQSNMPSYWPSSCYEMILFIRKEQSRLVLEGRPDWLQCDPVRGKEKIHQAEKPVALLKELIGRTTLPNSTVYDPFGGSGSTMEAAYEMKLQGIYCELDKEIYSLAINRLKSVLK